MASIGEATKHRIMLQSGSIFDLKEPETSEINIEDIAHGLAHTCRFAGQCKAFYSVAEHSVLVSKVVPEAGLAALLHDAAEAFVGDMTRPLKQLLPEFAKIEKKIERAIFQRFEIEWPPPSSIKAADYSVMAAEQVTLMPPGTNEWLSAANISPANVVIRYLDPKAAKTLFLDRYAELLRARRK
jgi:uncharacterized protein